MQQASKYWTLSRLAVTHPVELLDRLEVFRQAKKQQGRTVDLSVYPRSCSMEESVRSLSSSLGLDLTAIINERELQNTHAHTARLTAELENIPNLPFPTCFNADSTLMQLCYAMCRVLQPEAVLETGVGYGVTSSAILAALHKNQKGTLHSIDLPPLGDWKRGAYIGVMVPAEYAQRWRLYRGSSKRLLEPLLSGTLSKVNIFVHDSANVFTVQKREFEAVWPRLASPSAVIANNVGNNSAFAEFVREKKIADSFVIRQKVKKGELTGLILLHLMA